MTAVLHYFAERKSNITLKLSIVQVPDPRQPS